MRTGKFQLVAALMAGVVVGQTAMAVEFLSLRNTIVPVGDAAEIGSQTLVVLNTETGEVNDIETVFNSEDGGSPFVAIDRNPFSVGSSLDFIGLTQTGELISVAVEIIGSGEFQETNIFTTEIAQLFREDFAEVLDFSSGAGMAFNNDTTVGALDDLYITDGDELFLFDDVNVFATSSDDLAAARSALTTIGGEVVDRNLTSLASLAGNTLFAIGDAPPESDDTIVNGETDDGLYTVEDDPFLDDGSDNPDFGELTSLDGELYPDAFDTSSAFGSFYGLVIPNPTLTDPNPDTILTHMPNPNDLLIDPTLKPTTIDAFAPGALNGLLGLAPVNAPAVDASIPEPVTGVLGLMGLTVLGAVTKRRVA